MAKTFVNMQKKLNFNLLFQDDEKRTKLAIKGNLKALLETYKIKRKIKNPNTRQFWEQKFQGKMKTGNFMAEDRIQTAATLLPKNAVDVLDIGVGGGELEKILSQMSENIGISGIDITENNLVELRKTVKGNFKTGTILRIPFRRKFDVVIALEVLEHLPAHRVFIAYNEIKRVLRKNGRVIFSVPLNELYTSDFNPNAHLRRYSYELFKSELFINDFKIEKEKLLFAFNNLYYLKSILAKFVLMGRWKPNVILVVAKKK